LKLDKFDENQATKDYPLWRVFIQRYGRQWFPSAVINFLQDIEKQNPFHLPDQQTPFYKLVEVPSQPQCIIFGDEVDKLPAKTMQGSPPLNLFANANVITLDVLRTLRNFVLLGSVLPLVAGNQPMFFAIAAETSGFRHEPFFLSPFFDINAFYQFLEDNVRIAKPRYSFLS
jgi:hypothetical protein